MFNKLILVVAFMQAMVCSFCQGKKVQARSYELMLDALLSHSVNEVSAKELDSLVKVSDNLILLDAREKREYEVSHIKNAIWVGYNDFKVNRLKNVRKDSKVIVYCSVGARSEKVSEKLLKRGYSNVSNLYGGIFEWVNAGKEVVDSLGTTNKVHAYNKAWGVWLKNGEKVYK